MCCEGTVHTHAHTHTHTDTYTHTHKCTHTHTRRYTQDNLPVLHVHMFIQPPPPTHPVVQTEEKFFSPANLLGFVMRFECPQPFP